MARAERNYAQSLSSVARHIGELINAYPGIGDLDLVDLTSMLNQYAKALTPWAKKTAYSMIMEVNQRDIDMWQSLSSAMGSQLRFDVEHTSVGSVIYNLMEGQTKLITSLPTEAAERVQKLTVEGLYSGRRSTEIIEQIQESGQVAYSRAKLIARTETAKAASNLTQARAQSAGITHYVWETSRDASVRPGHKAMQGKVCAWATPPAVEENGKIMYHHPGNFPNCRCFSRSIFPS